MGDCRTEKSLWSNLIISLFIMSSDGSDSEDGLMMLAVPIRDIIQRPRRPYSSSSSSSRSSSSLSSSDSDDDSGLQESQRRKSKPRTVGMTPRDFFDVDSDPTDSRQILRCKLIPCCDKRGRVGRIAAKRIKNDHLIRHLETKHNIFFGSAGVSNTDTSNEPPSTATKSTDQLSPVPTKKQQPKKRMRNEDREETRATQRDPWCVPVPSRDTLIRSFCAHTGAVVRDVDRFLDAVREIEE